MQTFGMDVGHSSTKISVAIDGASPAMALMQSVVCGSFSITDEAERARAGLETVRVDGNEYFVGRTAAIQGQARVIGLSEHWVETPEYSALMLGAWAMAQRTLRRSLVDPVLVMGLPTHLYRRQRQMLKQLALRRLPVSESRIKVVPQAIAPYHFHMLSEAGAPEAQRDMAQQALGIVEVGHFTTDFTVVREGRWIEKASGVCPGVHVAAEHLVHELEARNVTIDLLEAEKALVAGTIQYFGSTMDVRRERDKAVRDLVRAVTDTASRLMEQHVRELNAVLVAGGGASIVFDTLAQRWPHARLLPDPRYSVAEGMRRFGAAYASVKRTTVASVQ